MYIQHLPYNLAVVFGIRINAMNSKEFSKALYYIITAQI